jgi:glycosyltransferase involved in cell wall biosynthesis
MPTLAIVSFRLGAADGVSVEAAKWQAALVDVGFEVLTIAGEGIADRLVPTLAIDAAEKASPGEIKEALDGADIVVVENACSLPLNPSVNDALVDVLRDRRAILHHHDLPWQRERFGGVDDMPADDEQWLHVTINDLSRRQLAERGIDATTIPNAFDVDEKPGDRIGARAGLEIATDERLVLQPTRAIARKQVPVGLALAESLGATYWLLGPTEEGYDGMLADVLAGASVRTIFGRPPGMRMADVYAVADAVALPSAWEGFGNATIESAIHHRPLAIHPYPVAAEIGAYGFRWFPVEDPALLAGWLTSPDTEVLELNHAIARRHFSRDALRRRIRTLLAGAGWLP